MSIADSVLLHVQNLLAVLNASSRFSTAFLIVLRQLTQMVLNIERVSLIKKIANTLGGDLGEAIRSIVPLTEPL